MDKYEYIYEFSKHSENFHKFNNFDFYRGQMATEFGIIENSPLFRGLFDLNVLVNLFNLHKNTQ